MFELMNPGVLKSDEAAPTNHQAVDGAEWEHGRVGLSEAREAPQTAGYA
jgi:hypothetical protein